MKSEDAVRIEEKRGGALWQVTLDRPKGNILDVEVSAKSRLPQLLFFVAFMAGGVVIQIMALESFSVPPYQGRSLIWIFIGGVLVAFGTTWANGCTSGHGIAGVSRLSIRSLVAVPAFMGGVFVFLPIFNILLGG